jgi:hypothetical protein
VVGFGSESCDLTAAGENPHGLDGQLVEMGILTSAPVLSCC